MLPMSVFGCRIFVSDGPPPRLVYNSRRAQAQEACIQMLDRRRFLGVCSALGVSSTLFPGVLWALAEQKEKVTKQMIDEAALVADVPIADEYKQMMLDGLNDQIKGYEEIFKLNIANSVPPALIFDHILTGME